MMKKGYTSGIEYHKTLLNNFTESLDEIYTKPLAVLFLRIIKNKFSQNYKQGFQIFLVGFLTEFWIHINSWTDSSQIPIQDFIMKILI